MLAHVNAINAVIARLDSCFFLGTNVDDIVNEYLPLKIWKRQL
jgi:hypothetical protein